MSRLIYKIKNNKLIFSALAVLFSVLVFDLFVAVFDIVQFISLQKNAVNRFSGFIQINILAGILNVLVVALIIVYLIISKRKIKVHLDDKKSH